MEVPAAEAVVARPVVRRWGPRPETGRWAGDSSRAANGTGSWVRVATAAVQRRGRVAFALRAQRVFQYRLVAAGTPRSWNLVSPVRKI
jgi:hypothetical protein